MRFTWELLSEYTGQTAHHWFFTGGS